MPPSQNPEVKEISARMAHLSALLERTMPTSEFKPLWFEYRDLKARRQVIEAEAKAKAKAGQTGAPKPTSLPDSHTNGKPDDTQGMLSIRSPGLQLWLRCE